jgi:RNase P subunit RPR2
MTGHTPASHTRARICPNCDGFATAAVPSGTRHRDGTRALLHIDCRFCHGTGTVPLRPRLTATDVEVAA